VVINDGQVGPAAPSGGTTGALRMVSPARLGVLPDMNCSGWSASGPPGVPPLAAPPSLALTACATAQNATALRRTFRRWADAVVDDDTAENLTLAVYEALINAVEHAFTARTAPGSLWLHATVTDDQVVLITITDDGTWHSPRDAPGHRGRGLALMHQLTTHTHVELTPKGQPCAYDTSSCQSIPLGRTLRALCRIPLPGWAHDRPPNRGGSPAERIPDTVRAVGPPKSSNARGGPPIVNFERADHPDRGSMITDASRATSSATSRPVTASRLSYSGPPTPASASVSGAPSLFRAASPAFGSLGGFSPVAGSDSSLPTSEFVDSDIISSPLSEISV
jgi:serine/threonine-protein kinase RsbW